MRPKALTRYWYSRLLETGRRHAVALADLRQLEPIFVIGANRSGTSLMAWLLSQHSEIEGLFSGAIAPETESGEHMPAYCESPHVWWWLNESARSRIRQGDTPFWALPEYIAQYYRRHAHNDRERFELAWAVHRHRQTNRRPLMKDVYNVLRVGLIADVFPNARFVLITRPWSDYGRKVIAKHYGPKVRDKFRTADGSSGAAPVRAGMHWYLCNFIARYELEAHAPGRFVEVFLPDIVSGPEQARATLEDVCRSLDLPPLSHFHLPRTAKLSSYWQPGFDFVRELVRTERAMWGNGS